MQGVDMKTFAKRAAVLCALALVLYGVIKAAEGPSSLGSTISTQIQKATNR